MTEAASQRRRGLGRFLVGLLIVLAFLEVAARGVEASSSPALRWYDAATQLRVDKMATLEDVDVVFAGTSMVWQGMVPATWTANDALGRTAFNVAMAGGVPEVMEPWLLDVVQPSLHPDLVVWGLGSLDFASNYGADNLERYLDALEARQGFLANLERLTARFSALVRYRNVLRDPAEWGQDRGFGEAATTLGPGGERRDFADDISPQRQRQVAARLADFTIDTADIAAIHRTVVQLRAAGTDVVFVQMPVPERYVELHPGGVAEVEAVQRAIVRLGEVLQVDVIDATGGFTDADFVDFTHLDEPSAARLTAQVAGDLTGGAVLPVQSTASDAELIAVAADLVAVADEVRSAMTLKGSMPASSEVWNSLIEYGHTRDLWAYHEEGTAFHTIFTGSSLVYAGIDPALYAAETGLSAYNMGLPAGGPEEAAAFLADVVFPTMKPQRIVLGVAPHDYWARSSGDSCADQLTTYKAARDVRSGAFASIDWFRDVPTENLVLGDPINHDSARVTPMHAEYRRVFSLLGDRTFYPRLGRRALEARPANIAAALDGFTFCQERFDTFVGLVAELSAAGYETIVVAMPLSSYRIDPLPGGRQWVEEIMGATEAAVLAAGAEQYIDLKDLLEDDQFYDLTHANFAASQQVTMALVEALAD